MDPDGALKQELQVRAGCLGCQPTVQDRRIIQGVEKFLECRDFLAHECLPFQ
jgi:hypothetical protein